MMRLPSSLEITHTVDFTPLSAILSSARAPAVNTTARRARVEAPKRNEIGMFTCDLGGNGTAGGFVMESGGVRGAQRNQPTRHWWVALRSTHPAMPTFPVTSALRRQLSCRGNS